MVRERYPRFTDALADVDDALTLTYLFASLPSEHHIKSKVTNTAKSLSAAWGAYCATTGCITKSFISVKGVYLEALIRGIPIRWIVPHSFTQFMPDDVDYRVMTTFFEFYETLLQFILFKLYNDLGVRYPLSTVDLTGEVKGTTSNMLGSNLRALENALKSDENAISNVISESMEERPDPLKHKSKAERKKGKELIKTVATALNSIEESDEENGEDDEVEDVDVAGPFKAALESMADEEARAGLPEGESGMDDDALRRRRLFAGLTFFFSREIPRGYLELVSLSYGAKVGWEGANSPINANDSSITHHIVDRPTLPTSYDSLPKSREFVQPQWILDSANFMFLLPVLKYSIGATLPPHLSPWVDNEEEGYKPAYAEEIERLKNGEVIESGDDDVAQPATRDLPHEPEMESGDEGDEKSKSGDEQETDEEVDSESEEVKERVERKRRREVRFLSNIFQYDSAVKDPF